MPLNPCEGPWAISAPASLLLLILRAEAVTHLMLSCLHVATLLLHSATCSTAGFPVLLTPACV